MKIMRIGNFCNLPQVSTKNQERRKTFKGRFGTKQPKD